MHARIRNAALVVLVALQLEACLRERPTEYGIVEVSTCKRQEPDGGGAIGLLK